MFWLAQAPSNIALIKYMGKKDTNANLPDNPSLSYTLNNLLSTVKLELLPGKNDIWEPLNIPGAAEFTLATSGQQRFINHLQRIKLNFGYEGGFLLQSNNNFPHGSGLASSASSFAALTKCACLALSELTNQDLPTIHDQAELSRLGSGSSCRSFFEPWALWDDEGARSVDLPYSDLLHHVVVISNKEKTVSSSEAHKRVKTSPFYRVRVQNAEENLKVLLNAMQAEDWASAFHICWREFQEMHNLFHTSEEPFSYMTDASLELLKILEGLWNKEGDGPIVTMDAGPNIHLLYRTDQQEMADRFRREFLVGNYDVL